MSGVSAYLYRADLNRLWTADRQIELLSQLLDKLLLAVRILLVLIDQAESATLPNVVDPSGEFFLVGKGIVPWNGAILRSSRDHSCKQLLCLLMEYSDPEIEEILAQGKKHDARHREMMRLFDELKRIPALPGVVDAAELARLIDRRNQLWSEVNRLKKEREREEYFPPHIADAINLLRNEKIRGWETRSWYSDEKYDQTAQAIADGARDRDKQDALYVRVGKTGEVASVPERIDEAAVDRARERAKKLRWFLKGAVDHGGHQSSEYKRLLDTLKVMFASPEEVKVMFPQTEETKANASG